ncbi:porin [Rhodospirillum rubrum]|nr:porin [Rhodospirillum rubrum]AEO48740.1 porin [Rhodospirillum rubrum F11]QXG78995.1 porin [Rhodospirillum rubrum]CAB99326.1 porin 41 (Por41) [Rhodospirillum rubrum]
MKKVLFGTTMLVAAGAFAGAAVAADPITLKLGGKQEQYFGGVASTKDGGREDGFGIDTDTEVYFSGSTTLDNGITVAARIELEAEADNANNADKQWVTVSGAFGKIEAGQRSGVFDEFMVVAPTVGSVSLDDSKSWLGAGNGINGSVTQLYLDQSLDDDDAKVTYVTPQFYGFSAGVSYTPNVGGPRANNSSIVAPTKKNRDLVQMAVGYDAEFGDVGLKASAAAATQSNLWIYQGGVNVSYAGFTLGGAYTEYDDQSAAAVASWDADASEGRVWTAGLSYAVGPYSVGFTYGQTDNDSKSGVDAAIYKIGGDYKMGPGIDLVGNVFYGETGIGSSNVDASREGFGAVTGIVLAF